MGLRCKSPVPADVANMRARDGQRGEGRGESDCVFPVCLCDYYRLPVRLFIPSAGCKVESIFLNIEAVNTHRERPEVSCLSAGSVI